MKDSSRLAQRGHQWETDRTKEPACNGWFFLFIALRQLRLDGLALHKALHVAGLCLRVQGEEHGFCRKIPL